MMVKKVLKQCLKLFFALILIFTLLLIILEVALNMLSLHSSDSADRGVVLDNGFYVLALGDSHTYGVGVHKNYSYPSQLERLLNKNSSIKYKVVNLGIPGQNSAELKKSLQKHISTYKPKIFIMLIGNNNLWNYAEMPFYSLPSYSFESVIHNFLYRLKVFDVFRFLFHYNNINDYNKYAQNNVSEKIDLLRETTKNDLLYFSKIARDNNITLFFLSYPNCVLWINSIIKEIASEESLFLIDTCNIFSAYNDPSLFFENGHLREKGYYIMAKSIQIALIKSKVLPGSNQ